jgi:hypothetical protein
MADQDDKTESGAARTDEDANHSVWLARAPSPSACCPSCDSREIANVRTFSTGSGAVFRTLIDDIYCRRCGYMGQPNFVIAERSSGRGGAAKDRR